jgi:protein TonB
MRIDRYVHDERLTWGAAGVLLVVTAVHAVGVGRLLITQPEAPPVESPSPIFQVTLEKLPPPRLPPQVQPQSEDAPVPASDAVKPPPRQTRPVPILVDTPTTDPVPPGTQVKPYEIGDELLPGVPGPPVEGGTPEGVGFDSAPAVPKRVYAQLKLLEMKPPAYPPRCLRMGIEGRVLVRALIGENGLPQEVTLGKTSGEAALDEAAMEAVRHWRFEAARRNGVPVRAWVRVPVEFQLID